MRFQGNERERLLRYIQLAQIQSARVFRFRSQFPDTPIPNKLLQAGVSKQAVLNGLNPAFRRIFYIRPSGGPRNDKKG